MLLLHYPVHGGKLHPTCFCYALSLATLLLPASCGLYCYEHPGAYPDLIGGVLMLLVTVIALAAQLTALQLLSRGPVKHVMRRRRFGYSLLATSVLTFTFGFSYLTYLWIR